MKRWKECVYISPWLYANDFFDSETEGLGLGSATRAETSENSTEAAPVPGMTADPVARSFEQFKRMVAATGGSVNFRSSNKTQPRPQSGQATDGSCYILLTLLG